VTLRSFEMGFPCKAIPFKPATVSVSDILELLHLTGELVIDGASCSATMARLTVDSVKRRRWTRSDAFTTAWAAALFLAPASFAPLLDGRPTVLVTAAFFSAGIPAHTISFTMVADKQVKSNKQQGRVTGKQAGRRHGLRLLAITVLRTDCSNKPTANTETKTPTDTLSEN